MKRFYTIITYHKSAICSTTNVRMEDIGFLIVSLSVSAIGHIGLLESQSDETSSIHQTTRILSLRQMAI